MGGIWSDCESNAASGRPFRAPAGRSPPPPRISYPSISEVEIGYDLQGPPTVARVLLDWRFDLILGTAAIVLALVYLAGVRRLRRRGDAWPAGRTAAWLSGCFLLLFATSNGRSTAGGLDRAAGEIGLATPLITEGMPNGLFATFEQWASMRLIRAAATAPA